MVVVAAGSSDVVAVKAVVVAASVGSREWWFSVGSGGGLACGGLVCKWTQQEARSRVVHGDSHPRRGCSWEAHK
jgi:hypothetical protein